jgi:hypothetical protein
MMVTAAGLRALKLAETFTPFRIHMKDGTAVEVLGPQLIVVGTQSAVVGMPDAGRQDLLADRFTLVWYDYADRVELLDTDPPITVQAGG